MRIIVSYQVRLQVQGEGGVTGVNRGLVGTVANIVKHEGATALYGAGARSGQYRY